MRLRVPRYARTASTSSMGRPRQRCVSRNTHDGGTWSRPRGRPCTLREYWPGGGGGAPPPGGGQMERAQTFFSLAFLGFGVLAPPPRAAGAGRGGGEGGGGGGGGATARMTDNVNSLKLVLDRGDEVR